MKILKLIIIYSFVFCLNGCGAFSQFSHTNIKINQPIVKSKASFIVNEDRGSHQKTLVILSLSGGGSRAAYFSASIMLALENVFKQDKLNILEEVDIISSVSGGSLAAAFYVTSKDLEDKSKERRFNQAWDRETVTNLMSLNFRRKWLLSWFWPTNIVKFWFTAFDRSDMMAQTLADNLFDMKFYGFDLKFKDINHSRPNIVLNSTNGTIGDFSSIFTFTQEQFEKINSDINEYKVSRAVMATASFPGAFNYMTLKDFHSVDDKYVHVFDGGNSDNLGLKSVEKIIDKNKGKYKKIIVILVDSYTEGAGVSSSEYDGRKTLDYAVDLNFIDSSDSLLSINRENTIDNLSEKLEERGGPKEFVFYHVQFSDISNIQLKNKLNSIKTDFRIKEEDTESIDQAVSEIIVKDNLCLIKIKEVLLKKTTNHKDWLCTWEVPAPHNILLKAAGKK
ncbi:MAG: patatin-like phospholipase family protein [Methylococcaceae bacterium]|nr:patatin-like phospholipase family protein [Methylococcaceae bacterium]